MEAEEKKPVLTVDLAITLVVAVACVYMFVAAREFRLLGRLFPQVISGVTLLACIAQAVISIRKSRAGAPAKKREGPALHNHLYICAVSIAYLVIMPYLGFVIASIALTLVIPLILGNRNKTVICIVGVALTLIFYIVFKRFFYVPLPAGILPF